MSSTGRETALSEAQAALDNLPEEDEEGIKQDNIAFDKLLDAVFALRRVAPDDSDARRNLDAVHDDVVDAYTNVRDRDGGYVDADERQDYVNRIEEIRETLDTQSEE